VGVNLILNKSSTWILMGMHLVLGMRETGIYVNTLCSEGHTYSARIFFIERKPSTQMFKC